MSSIRRPTYHRRCGGLDYSTTTTLNHRWYVSLPNIPCQHDHRVNELIKNIQPAKYDHGVNELIKNIQPAKYDHRVNELIKNMAAWTTCSVFCIIS